MDFAIKNANKKPSSRDYLRTKNLHDVNHERRRENKGMLCTKLIYEDNFGMGEKES